MTSLWQLTDPNHIGQRAAAAKVAHEPKVTHRPDGTIAIYIPMLTKLLDPHNVCLCPTCLLPNPLP